MSVGRTNVRGGEGVRLLRPDVFVYGVVLVDDVKYFLAAKYIRVILVCAAFY